MNLGRSFLNLTKVRDLTQSTEPYYNSMPIQVAKGLFYYFSNFKLCLLQTLHTHD